MSTLKLGVNIDHVATLRQARGASYPDVLDAARLCESTGVDGITIHLREDRRHIQDADVVELRRSVGVLLNLEMACNEEIAAIAAQIRPDEVCLVPEKRRELTTEGGLDVAGQIDKVARTVELMKQAGSIASLFIDPDRKQLDAAAEIGAPCVELHTGSFCIAFDSGRKREAEEEIQRLKESAQYANSLSIQVNAGHGINMGNIREILRIPFLDTLNIGHSIISRAIFIGLSGAIEEIRGEMNRYTGGED
ncbi:MAG: pyridoxine 5'-phosphate synthase [Verrucomicrobiota bacterium]